MQLIAIILTFFFFKELIQYQEGAANWIQNNMNLTLASIMCQMFGFGQIICPWFSNLTYVGENEAQF